MRRILDVKILNQYIIKHNIERIFDDEILKYVQLHFYEKEEHILESGENLKYYYLLVDGKIKIYYPFENGKSMFLKFYKDFNTIGDLELLKGIPILCNIDAVEDTYLIAIPAAILRGKYFNNIKLLNHLVDSLSEKLCGTINNSSYNFVYPLINRLSSYLVEHLTDKNYIILNSSYLEIAQFLGATYRHLNRTLKEMESKSIIKCDDKKIYILDIEQLKELSKNMYIKSL
ncbi:helix-turn-helix domain-containing protein [Clostridium sp. FP2]|uniref:Crp/Fnr family transcriptional regulator n=1 Tax=Clostridium sp. FP2 TaxID=2724481 RepID=UPI0013E99DC3|nr:helix-turn-helix domain-containing protein [Clostridium sp. FP2]MBZ9625855.1 helix-turn-helix domain-containing protein [Clostridium sp. FP2]